MTSDDACVPDPPSSWAHRLTGYQWQLQSEGASDALVFRLHAAHKQPLFVKTEPLTSLAELPGEIARLHWLSVRNIPCPRVLAHARTEQRTWLLMSAMPGMNLESCVTLGGERVARIAADALCQLHALKIADCPFDHRFQRRLADARARIEAGLVDAADFDAEHAGMQAQALYEELLRQQPTREYLVITHGDACLSNLMTHEGCFSGFIDCGRLGIADRYQDLALVARDLEENFGASSVGTFFSAYGAHCDADRLTLYRLLDEFF